ncbi:diguanylate cyclase [Salinisphaera sp. T5B8]|uniref:sensor domain-containing diguanylate cyclase n=1 Tax=Salinisphaera sp. T5B8 TaxID=1304154 RepID=UPI003341678C
MLGRKKLYSAIALAGVLVLGFIATSVISYFLAEDSVSGHIADETLPLTSDNIYSEIEQDLLRSVLISSLMAHDTLLRDWTIDGEDEPEKIVRYLKEIQQKYDTTTAFYVSEKTRNYYHADGVLKQVSRDDPQDAWYFRARKLNAPYEINVDTDTADLSRLTIFVNYRVTNYRDRLIGVTGIGLSVDSVARLIANYQTRYDREIYLTDRQGRVTLRGPHFVGPDTLRDRPGMQHIATTILANPSASVSYENDDGRRVYVNSRLIPEFNWYLIVQQAQSSTEARVLGALLINIAVALAIAALVVALGWYAVRNYQQGLEQMAGTDTLTGCTTRRLFEAIFNQVRNHAIRNNAPLSLLAIDIDHFKQINDQYGHAAGDLVLYTLTDIFRSHLRDNDTLCRWGGDEFLILLSDCTLPNAIRVADAIRAAVASHPIRASEQIIDCTISVGAAEYQPTEELRSLVARADLAMYSAKRDGRDQVAKA